MSDDLELPARTRLFHIGIPKSGTTSLQAAARASRDALRKNGVLYPGFDTNHRTAVLSFMGRRWGTPGEPAPPPEHWDDLMEEIEAETRRRIFITHEFASESDDEMAARFVDTLGEHTHVVVTLRSLGAILPSAWQQYVKTGVSMRFDKWLEAVLGDPPDDSVTSTYHRRNDQGGVVSRWAKVAGPDRVTVVILDREHPRLLFDSFESMLGVPQGTLVEQEMGGFASNRGLTVPEVELFRAFNRVIKPYGVGWELYQRTVRQGALGRVMEFQDGSKDRLRLPAWAVERASEKGAGYAEAIATSGVRVVGDLQTLAEEVPARADDAALPTMVPIDLAADALAGMYSAAAWRGPFFGVIDRHGEEQEKALRMARVKRESSRFTTRELISLGFWFLGLRARKLLRRIRRR
ncbi:hypothetical protein [Aeromicrobium sp.]|uniref:hypothetical protein n=1 Tax=Aeromicrobium sp. TaxID=1871063 RepID=UPI003D6B23B3